MQLQSLKDLFHEELKDLYSAEAQIIDALPMMIDAVKHEELASAFRDHLEKTRGHRQRIEEICDQLGVDPRGHACKGMKGIIAEGDEFVEADGDANARDAAIIGAAQRAEHYEMAGYGTARTHARRLDLDDVAEKLQGTLDEEMEADRLLTELAEKSLNREAVAR